MFGDIEDKIPQKSIVLNGGDKIILYTDGMTEAHNLRGEMFGLARFIETVKKASPHFL